MCYAASYLKIENPTPYTLRNSSKLQHGINFAYGGTGIFNTLVDGPNMTLQIDSLEKLIQQKVYTKPDLESSIALLSAAGNDYAAFLVKNKTIVVSNECFIIFSSLAHTLNLMILHIRIICFHCSSNKMTRV